ncbi:hypothetical protein AB1L30_17240 [Bremerella sp. JC817]|uniref:hypothetical protein n=1 Tax=Bremerella sp. JC817 TaxID=3231756 RepID=UPI003459A1BE
MNWIRKHWGKVLLAGGSFVGLLVVLVIAAPTLISYGPVRNFLLHQLFNGKEVDVSVGSVSVGWFTPTEITNLKVTQNSGKYDIGVPRISNDVTLFHLLKQPRQLGNLKIESPLIEIELPSEEADLANDGPAEAPSLDKEKVQAALQRTIDVAVTDATVRVSKPGATQPWGFDKIGFLAQLRPGQTDAEGPTILIPRATLMDHQQMTQAMCDDMLKFVAPVVTGVTKVNGDISLSLEDIQVPLADHQNAVGKGKLVIHKAQLTGTPLVQKITEFVGLGPSVDVFSDCTINFELADKQVYHEGLDFGIGNLRVRTHGYVGLDKSLNLIAEIPIPLNPTEGLEEGELPLPFLTALRGKTIEIPITGTLDHPIIDKRRFGNSLMTTAESTLQDLLKSDEFKLDFEGEDGELDLEGVMGMAGALLKGTAGEGGLLDLMRERRQANQDTPSPSDPAGTDQEETPRKGLFRRLRERSQEEPAPKQLELPPPPETLPPQIDLEGAIDI